MLGEYELLLVANGAGQARAAAAVDCAAAAFLPEAIVSIGFCGALDDRLDVASVVVATEMIGPNGRFRTRAPAASLPHHLGVVLTIDHGEAQSAANRRDRRGYGGRRRGGACGRAGTAVLLHQGRHRPGGRRYGERPECGTALRRTFRYNEDLRFLFLSSAGPAAGVDSG
jgi:hypothetical protein